MFRFRRVKAYAVSLVLLDKCDEASKNCFSSFYHSKKLTTLHFEKCITKNKPTQYLSCQSSTTRMVDKMVRLLLQGYLL